MGGVSPTMKGTINSGRAKTTIRIPKVVGGQGWHNIGGKSWLAPKWLRCQEHTRVELDGHKWPTKRSKVKGSKR